MYSVPVGAAANPAPGSARQVELSIGGERQAIKEDEDRRQHVVRRFRRAVNAVRRGDGGLVGRLRSRDIGSGARHAVSGQAFFAGVFAQNDGGFADRGVLPEGVFDFAEFDAEAAQFYLMVEPPEVFDDAIGAVAGEIAGFVEAAFAMGIGK